MTSASYTNVDLKRNQGDDYHTCPLLLITKDASQADSKIKDLSVFLQLYSSFLT